MIRQIHLSNEAQIRRLSDLASKQPYEVWVSSPTVMLDARSMLGLFSLVGQDVNLVVEDDVNPDRFMRFVRKCEAE